MSFIFYDCETTGLDCNTQDVTELCGILINQDYTVSKQVFHQRLLIQNPSSVTEEALEISHYNEMQWQKTAKKADEGLSAFNDWLKIVSPKDRPFLVATNCEFDKGFLFSNCDRFSIFPFVNNIWIDLISYWVLYKAKTNNLHLGNSQDAMLEHFKIENKKAHSALHDSIAGAQVFCKIMKTIKIEAVK